MKLKNEIKWPHQCCQNAEITAIFHEYDGTENPLVENSILIYKARDLLPFIAFENAWPTVVGVYIYINTVNKGDNKLTIYKIVTFDPSLLLKVYRPLSNHKIV